MLSIPGLFLGANSKDFIKAAILDRPHKKVAFLGSGLGAMAGKISTIFRNV
jgi:hypothetical protein